MTTVLGRSGTPTTGLGRSSGADSRLPVPSAIRRPALAAGSVAVVLVSIAAFVAIYSGANHQVSVLTVLHPVAEGQPITSADLGADSITSQGALPGIPVAQASGVVGKVAAVPLVPGSLVVASDVTDTQPIASGNAVVGIALKDGQLPAGGLEPGDQVMVVQTDAPGAAVTNTPGATSDSGETTSTQSGSTTASGSSSTGVLVPQAEVRQIAAPSSSSSGGESALVSVEVSQTVAAEVAVAAAADQVSLVLLPQSGGRS